jgi:dTDP-4-amino-4,6-dideoxygalactose transaminase
MPEMARRAGLTPVFADVDPTTFNVTASSIERVLTPRTVAIVPTHLWGLPCDMDEIMSLATQRGLRVIEDCAHALGALYRGRPVGAFGDAAVFSFQTIKPLNAYGGGMAVVRDAALAARVTRLAAAAARPTVKRVTQRLWQGRVMRLATRSDVFTWTLFPLLYMGTRLHWSIDMYFWERIRPLDPLPAEYHERISNVQAAIALEGLGRLDAWTAARQQHAAQMSRWLDGIPGVRVPVMAADRTHAYYQNCVYVPARDVVVDYCLRRAIDLETLHVDLCAELPLFGSHPSAPGARETTATVQVPVYESLTDAQLHRVADVLRDAVRARDARTPATVHASP